MQLTQELPTKRTTLDHGKSGCILNIFDDEPQVCTDVLHMSADLRKGSFEHFSSFCVIKISKTSIF